MILSTAIQFLALQLLVEALPAPKKDPLQWSPCNLDFPEKLQSNIRHPIECATLEVPLDYSEPEATQLQLQLVRANATNASAKGSLIFAPGGPGVSGVEEVAQYGHVYSR